MSRTPDKNLITALDIGTSKVVALVAEQGEEGQLSIIGYGVASSYGLKKGVIVNIESTVKAIRKAVEMAEHMADCQIGSVAVGIAGGHIHSFNSSGVVAIRNQEVSQQDVDRVVDAAKAVAIPADQRILHILPQEYRIDNQEGIKEPLGMSGVRLEANVHMITGSISAAQNIVRCVNHCGIHVTDLVLEQIASSASVLTEDEKELGVCLVDIGGGTADISVFIGGAIQHTAVIPIAGAQVTSDLAHALRTSTQYAEGVKLQHGVAMTRLANGDETIEVAGVGDRPGRRVSMQTLASVIEARYEELFKLIYDNLQNAGYLDALTSGVVLTGGASKIPGALELAEEIFRIPVRLGVPQMITGLIDVVSNPVHATGVGLLLYSRDQQQTGGLHQAKPNKAKRKREAVNDDELSVWKRMQRWVVKHF